MRVSPEGVAIQILLIVCWITLVSLQIVNSFLLVDLRTLHTMYRVLNAATFMLSHWGLSVHMYSWRHSNWVNYKLFVVDFSVHNGIKASWWVYASCSLNHHQSTCQGKLIQRQLTTNCIQHMDRGSTWTDQQVEVLF